MANKKKINNIDWLIRRLNMTKFAFCALMAKNDILEIENATLKSQLKEKDFEIEKLQNKRRK